MKAPRLLVSRLALVVLSTIVAPCPSTCFAQRTAFTDLDYFNTAGTPAVPAAMSSGTPRPPLVPAGAVWKFLPVTNDIGHAWREAGFDDRSWASGPAQLGYGDQDEVTRVPFIPDEFGGKNVSTYFRHTFTVTNLASYSNLTLRVLRDDGAVVYLNGIEVFRSNMPEGEVNHATRALFSVSAPDENFIFFPTNLTAAALREGVNVLAVEIHQNSPVSQDISFDLELAPAGTRTLPPLAASRNAGLLRLTWPLWAADFRLFSATNLMPPVAWSAVTNLIQSQGPQWRADIPISDGDARVFRLEVPLTAER
jgi:hypothetical protein